LNGGIELYSYVNNPNASVDKFGLNDTFILNGNEITRTSLPDYDGATTHGTLFYEKDGIIKSETFISGGKVRTQIIQMLRM